MSQPDILLVGHITRDLVGETLDSGHRLGGTVSFAAQTALRMGRAPTIITRAASQVDLVELPPAVQTILLPSDVTTTFANVYTPAGRVQHCYTPANPITAEDIPTDQRAPHIVMLGTVIDEVGPDVAPIFAEETLVAAVPQGWMRRWDETGKVFPQPWSNASEILPFVDVLVASIEDVDHDLTRIVPWFAWTPLVVMTEYRDGSTLYQPQPDGTVRVTRVAPRPAGEVDPTGAGDIFATAFLVRLQETDDPVHSARFANVIASYGVEHLGIEGIPSRETALAYMGKFPFTPEVELWLP